MSDAAPLGSDSEQLKPFRIQLAERINRLPQYVLARVNALQTNDVRQVMRR